MTPLDCFQKDSYTHPRHLKVITMSIFSPVILDGYKFTDYDVLKEVITRFKNTSNVSRTCFDRDKSFQITNNKQTIFFPWPSK